MSRTLTALPLTAERFATFGDVLESSVQQKQPMNSGKFDRFDGLAQVDAGSDTGGLPSISIARSRAATVLPYRLDMLERHPKGSQAFMPLTGNPYLVVVAPPGELEPTLIRAFFAQTSQGVNYHKGTWHHYCLGLNISNDFLVVDRGGQGNNCDEVELPEDLEMYVNH